MTTIDLTATSALNSVAPSAAGTRLRLTRRGRRVLAVLASLPAVVAVSIAIVSGGSALASAELGGTAQQFDTVTVLPGDTLWSIAHDVAPGADPRDVVDDLVRLNALDTAQLRAGESLAIPAEYAKGH